MLLQRLSVVDHSNASGVIAGSAAFCQASL
jgi:hypothetical protein